MYSVAIAIYGQVADETQETSDDDSHEGVFVEEAVDCTAHQKYANSTRRIQLHTMLHDENDLS